MSFSDFNPGETFGFEADVDGPCSGVFCLVDVFATTVTGEEFAGSTMTAVFGGTGFATTELTGTFARTEFKTAAASINGEVTAVPEPGNIGVMAAGMALLSVRKLRVARR